MTAEQKAEEYANKHSEGSNSNWFGCKQAFIDGYSDGYREAENKMRQEVIKIFENNEDEQGKLWKACGLKLVGWDYENNRPDEQFNSFLNLVEEAEKK